jgi:hypothetical protein
MPQSKPPVNHKGKTSRPIIDEMVRLAERAEDDGFPVISCALVALAKVSAMDLPVPLCRAICNSCILASDTIVMAFRTRGEGRRLTDHP